MADTVSVPDVLTDCEPDTDTDNADPPDNEAVVLSVPDVETDSVAPDAVAVVLNDPLTDAASVAPWV